MWMFLYPTSCKNLIGSRMGYQRDTQIHRNGGLLVLALLKPLRINKTNSDAFFQTLIYRNGPLIKYNLNSGPIIHRGRIYKHFELLFFSICIWRSICFYVKGDLRLSHGRVALRASDNRVSFPKSSKATKLNNRSFRHLWDKNHIFRGLGHDR